MIGKWLLFYATRGALGSVVELASVNEEGRTFEHSINASCAVPHVVYPTIKFNQIDHNMNIKDTYYARI